MRGVISYPLYICRLIESYKINGTFTDRRCLPHPYELKCRTSNIFISNITFYNSKVWKSKSNLLDTAVYLRFNLRFKIKYLTVHLMYYYLSIETLWQMWLWIALYFFCIQNIKMKVYKAFFNAVKIRIKRIKDAVFFPSASHSRLIK